MAEEGGKTFWVYAQLEESLHTSLLEVCTEMGKHPREVVAIAVEDYIALWVTDRKKEGKAVGKKAELESIMYEERSRQIQENHLKSLAYAYQQNPTDEGMETLMRACNLVGISVEVIMEKTAGLQHVSQLIGEKGGLNAVETWLAETMKPGEQYYSTDILEMGHKMGYKEYVIKDAKRKLNIQSQKSGTRWVWVLPHIEQEPF